MLIRVKGKEYQAHKLKDQYTIIYYDSKKRCLTASTWNVEIFCDMLQDWLPFEKAYGEVIHCKRDSYELFEGEGEIEQQGT